ncbi:MAG: DUF2797 domain-containing protein [Acidimicrobiales bacterium]|nr:DUF2797 domain-containing protein [Acidimicrobiales bacterium]
MGTQNDHDSQVLLGLHWQEGSPVVRRRIENETESRFDPLVHMELHYRISTEGRRVCLGHTAMTKNGSRYNECRNKLNKGRKCPKCSAAEAMYAANLHHAHTKDRTEMSLEFRQHMEQPNYLYLARFSDGSIKVGTTTSQRKDRRLEEQGACQAMIVAKTPDGFSVRIIEDRITAELSIPQAVSTKRKITGLVSPKNTEQATEELSIMTHRVHHLLERADELDCEILQLPWENVGLQTNLWKNVHRYPRHLSTGAHSLKILGALGRVAAFTPDSSSDVFIADLGELFGIELENGIFPTEDLLVQDSLF